MSGPLCGSDSSVVRELASITPGTDAVGKVEARQVLALLPRPSVLTLVTALSFSFSFLLILILRRAPRLRFGLNGGRGLALRFGGSGVHGGSR